MSKTATVMLALVLGGCGGPAVSAGPVEGPDKGPIPPWEIVLVRSLTIDVGGCTSLEHMDKEVHVAPQGITIYVAHYKEGEADPASVPKKLISTIPPDDEPARTIIATVYEEGYYRYAEHPTFSLPGAEPKTGCGDEHETVTVTTPSTTGIITLSNDPFLPPPTGTALAIYDLVTMDL